jgi:hypothetical protein
MKFVHPEILWGLAALSIPVIVHLFNFRKFKKVLFSNVEFLQEIKHETQNKSKIKHLLILLARMLAITCLVFAFAQPYLPSGNANLQVGDKAISIYIDNSFSMEAELESAPVLEVAKNKAFEIVNAYKPTDRFQLITNDFEGRHQRLVTKEEMIDLIQEVQVSPIARPISEVVSRQKDLFVQEKSTNKTIYLISDFQSTTTNLAELDNPEDIAIRLVPAQATKMNNVFIDSLWFETPVRQLNQPEILHVKITNAGADDQSSIPVELLVNGVQKSVATAAVEANSTVELTLNYTQTEPGVKSAELKLDDHPVVFDNTFFFGYTVASEIKLADVIGADATQNPVRTVFEGDPFFKYTSMGENQIDFGQLGQQNLIVLNQIRSISSGLLAELQKCTSNGGSILLIPGLEADVASINALLQSAGVGALGNLRTETTRVSKVDYEHFLYKNIFAKPSENTDLPVAARYYPLTMPQRSTTTALLSFMNGDALLTHTPTGAGHLYVCTTPLDNESSNFIAHAFFPTSLLRIAEFSQPSSPLYYTIGSGENINLRQLEIGTDETFRLQNEKGGSEWIPEHRTESGNTELFIDNALNTSGNYALRLSGEKVADLSFNYNRKESNTALLDFATIQAILDEKKWTNIQWLSGSEDKLTAQAEELEDGKKYWYTMLVWTLIFLAIEVLLIKFWKR